MRTTLDLDDRVMEALLARCPGATKRAAVEHAIKAYLASDAGERLLALRGSIDIEDRSAQLRRDRDV
ncbi:MAG: type II toxin-antitoxin system VapB family antitoxin [Gaiellaceae bacterium]